MVRTVGSTVFQYRRSGSRPGKKASVSISAGVHSSLFVSFSGGGPHSLLRGHGAIVEGRAQPPKSNFTIFVVAHKFSVTALVAHHHSRKIFRGKKVGRCLSHCTILATTTTTTITTITPYQTMRYSYGRRNNNNPAAATATAADFLPRDKLLGSWIVICKNPHDDDDDEEEEHVPHATTATTATATTTRRDDDDDDDDDPVSAHDDDANTGSSNSSSITGINRYERQESIKHQDNQGRVAPTVSRWLHPAFRRYQQKAAAAPKAVPPTPPPRTTTFQVGDDVEIRHGLDYGARGTVVNVSLHLVQVCLDQQPPQQQNNDDHHKNNGRVTIITDASSSPRYYYYAPERLRKVGAAAAAAHEPPPATTRTTVDRHPKKDDHHDDDDDDDETDEDMVAGVDTLSSAELKERIQQLLEELTDENPPPVRSIVFAPKVRPRRSSSSSSSSSSLSQHHQTTIQPQPQPKPQPHDDWCKQPQRTGGTGGGGSHTTKTATTTKYGDDSHEDVAGDEAAAAAAAFSGGFLRTALQHGRVPHPASTKDKINIDKNDDDDDDHDDVNNDDRYCSFLDKQHDARSSCSPIPITASLLATTTTTPNRNSDKKKDMKKQENHDDEPHQQHRRSRLPQGKFRPSCRRRPTRAIATPFFATSYRRRHRRRPTAIAIPLPPTFCTKSCVSIPPPHRRRRRNNNNNNSSNNNNNDRSTWVTRSTFRRAFTRVRPVGSSR
jgi:hypothetical protein